MSNYRLCRGFDGNGGAVWYCVPTIKLALELAEKARMLVGDDSIKVVAIRGRTHDGGEDLPPLCIRHALVKEVAAAGIMNIRSALCQCTINFETFLCPYFDGCEYLEQFDQRIDILFGSSEIVFIPRTHKLKPPASIVFDELAPKPYARASGAISIL